MIKKILIVEDEAILARMLQKKLEKLGYDVTGRAAYGREAIELAEKTEPDLVLMDIVLKGDMDGIKAAQIIINRYQIPIVYLTAYADEKILKRAMITEPYGYILKPYNEKELKANIEIALYKDKVEQERKNVIKKRLQVVYYEYMLNFFNKEDADSSAPVWNYLKAIFEESFEEEVAVDWDQKLEDAGIDLENEDLDFVIEFFSSWIMGVYRDLGIRNEFTNQNNKYLLELFNCPWINYKNNNIFCLNCKAMIERSFSWTGINASIKDINTIIGGSSRCRFIINLRD